MLLYRALDERRCRRNWRIPFSGNLFISAVPGPAVRSPTADNQIGSRSISDGSRFYDLFFIEKYDRMEKTTKGRCRTCNTTRAAARSSARWKRSLRPSCPIWRRSSAFHAPCSRCTSAGSAACRWCSPRPACARSTRRLPCRPCSTPSRRISSSTPGRRAACPPRSACSKRP